MPRGCAGAVWSFPCTPKKPPIRGHSKFWIETARFDLDQREASWRGEGRSGYPGRDAWAASTATGGASQADLGSASSGGRADTTRATPSGMDEVAPVYEEQLRVGKRDVSHGRVRIRSYVVETPINEQVNLRNESVQVERRPVDRPVAVGETLFQDRIIEAEERAEEAVVSKSARVKEELTLRKTTEDRTQDIHDTVRHTEVEVEDGRGGVTGTGGARVRKRLHRPNRRAYGRGRVGWRQDWDGRSFGWARQN